MLICLLTGTASIAQPVSDKPFKVCPEVVKAKDTPCRVLGPTAVAANRMIVVKDDKDKEILDLKERIKKLEAENSILKEVPKVDIEKPSATRSIRG